MLRQGLCSYRATVGRPSACRQKGKRRLAPHAHCTNYGERIVTVHLRNTLRTQTNSGFQAFCFAVNPMGWVRYPLAPSVGHAAPTEGAILGRPGSGRLLPPRQDLKSGILQNAEPRPAHLRSIGWWYWRYGLGLVVVVRHPRSPSRALLVGGGSRDTPSRGHRGIPRYGGEPRGWWQWQGVLHRAGLHR